MKLKLDTVYFGLICVVVVGLVVFSYGFFPVSHSSPEKADRFDFPTTLGSNIEFDHSTYYSHFHRVILMVIDALRWDFVAEGGRMSYLSNLIGRNESCLIKLRVHPPTVTMPRIKAMTSGTIPNFIDLVLNFGANEMRVDNFIAQMKATQGKLVFYGDNTWTKMFPNVFTRQGENVDSLYVNDFYEGDKNITDRLNAEIVHPDWKMMILHYLGLDHIGHVEGPFSDKVPPKLEEMDKQVTKIVTAMAKWKLKSDRPSLFLLTGDHGMRDTGGHGGSSPGETFVPLVVTGAQCESSDTIYNQIDLATTASVLLGLPIPSSAIGTIIPELLGDLSPEQQLFAYHYNGERLLAKIRDQFRLDRFGEKEFFKQHQEAVELHRVHLLADGDKSSPGLHLFKRARLLYQSSAQEMSHMLSQTFLKYDLASISLGIFIVILATLTMVSGVFFKSLDLLEVHLKAKDCVTCLIIGMLLKHILCKLITIESELFRFNIPTNVLFLLFICIFIYIYHVIRNCVRKIGGFQGSVNFIGKFIILVTILHLISLGASSFIEEEHQIWYFFSASLFLILFVRDLNLNMWHDNELILFRFPNSIEKLKKRRDLKDSETILKKIENCHNSIFSFLLLIVTHVIIRRLNQTGDKWSHLRDLGDFLMEKDSKAYLTGAVILGMILTCYSLCSLGGLLTNILTLTALLLVFFYRASMGQILIFNSVFSSAKMPVILFWLNVLEVFVIEFLPFVYRLFIQREMNRIQLARFMGSLVTVFAIISVLLHKPHNILLVPICILTCRWMKEKIFAIYSDCQQRTMLIIVSHFWIGKMFFFYQGNSNSLATIDLNAGYIGLETYHPLIVGIFLTLNTFWGPIMCFLLTLCHLYEQVCLATLTSRRFEEIRSTIEVNVFRVQSLLIALPLAVYVVVAAHFRNHLFVWTVFSPKLIYEIYSYGIFLVCWIAYFGWARVVRQFTKIKE